MKPIYPFLLFIVAVLLYSCPSSEPGDELIQCSLAGRSITPGNVQIDTIRIQNESVVAFLRIIELGQVNEDGKVPSFGICWSEQENPTIFDNKIDFGATDQKGLIEKSLPIDDLKKYHYRPFIVNCENVTYGLETTFPSSALLKEPNLFAHYVFDNGFADDISGNGNTVSNNQISLSQDSPANKGFSLSAGQSVLVLNSRRFQLNGGDNFNISFWMKLNFSLLLENESYPNPMARIFSFDLPFPNDESRHFGFINPEQNSPDEFFTCTTKWRSSNGCFGERIVGFEELPSREDQWHYISLNKIEEDIEIYVDGQKYSTIPARRYFYHENNSIRMTSMNIELKAIGSLIKYDRNIGCFDSSSEENVFLLDNLRFYNTSLERENINYIYQIEQVLSY